MGAETIKYFEKQTLDREKSREEKRERMEEEEKRNKIMEEQRVAIQKQKYAKPQIDINDEAQFPSLVGNSKSDSHSNSDKSDKEQSVSPILRSYSSMALRPKSKPIVMKKTQSCDYNENINGNGKKKKKRHRGGKKRNKKQKKVKGND